MINFPVTPIIDLSNSILCLFCSIKLYNSYKKEPENKVIEYFYKAYVALVVAYLFFSLSRLIWPSNSFALGVCFISAHVFLFLATGFFLMVTVFILKPEWHRIFFGFYLILALGAIVLNIVNFNYPEYDRLTGITNWHINSLVGTIFTILFSVVLIPSTILFLYQGARTKTKIVKVRSLLIGFGIILLIIAAVTYYSANTQIKALISDFFSLSAFLFIFLGVYYKRQHKII